MKKLILAAVLTLGTGASFAQGLPPGSTPPQYGTHAFTGQSRDNGSFLSELFGHSKKDQAEADKKSSSAQGG
jgi:hypothetical protein